jgi:hypothetical protein
MRAVVTGAFAMVVVGIGAATSVTAAPPASRLSPSDIQSTFFNGQPFTASTPSNVRFTMTFTADGKMKRLPIGSGSKGEGTWKLSKDGFCTALERRERQMLHGCQRRRQQMVRAQRLDHHGDVD